MLKFATNIEAMQYLSDITGKRVKIALSQSVKRYYSVSRKKNGIVDFWVEKEFDQSWVWSEHVITAIEKVKGEIAKVKSSLSEFKTTDLNPEGPSVGSGNTSSKLGVTMDAEMKFNTEEEMAKIVSVLEELEYDQFKR